MTTDLVTAKKGISLTQANQILKNSKKGKLPIVDGPGRLIALMSRKDLLKNMEYPLASKDPQKQLMVGAAISTKDESRERLDALVEAGVDIVVIRLGPGEHDIPGDMIKYIKKKYPLDPMSSAATW